jgi:hypothetical protein
MAQGGTTFISGQILDPAGNKYVNSQVNISFFDPGTSGKLPLLSGSTFQTQYTYQTDSFGNLPNIVPIALPDNGAIAASSGATGTQWIFRVVYQDRVTSFTTTLTINCSLNLPATCTGNTINLTAALQAASAPLPGTLVATATSLLGPGNILGTFGGNHTNTGIVTDTNAASTYAGNAATATTATTATSAATVTALLKICSVNSTTVGADLGAKVNTCNTALGSNAGEIWIDSSAGTTWTTPTTFSGPRKIKFINGASYSIPLGSWTFSTNAASIIDCGGRQQAILNFTGASGVAVKANWAQFASGSYADWSYGVRDCSLIGPGSINGGNANAGTGIQIGDVTNSTIGFLLDNSVVAGFAVGITWGNVNAWGTRIQHSSFLNNGTFAGGVQVTAANFLFNLATGGGMENLDISHTVFGQNSASPVYANDITIAGTGVLEMNCSSCSFDTSQINVNGSSFNKISFTDKHQELLINASNPLLVINSGIVTDDAPRFALDGGATSPASVVTVSGGAYLISKGAWQATVAPTQGILQSGTGSIAAYSPFAFDSNVPGITNGGSGYLLNFAAESGFLSFTGLFQGTSIRLQSLPVGVAGFAVFGGPSGIGQLSNNGGTAFNVTQTIASSTVTMTTALIAAGACGTTVTVGATGALTTDTITWAFNAVPAANPAQLVVSAWPTANNLNFQYCNPTAAGITPNAATLNWRLVR